MPTDQLFRFSVYEPAVDWAFFFVGEGGGTRFTVARLPPPSGFNEDLKKKELKTYFIDPPGFLPWENRVAFPGKASCKV